MSKQENSDFKVIKMDEHGGKDDNSIDWVNSDEGWTKYWTDLHAFMTPEPEKPQINFNEKSVIVIHFGLRTHGGFSADVKKIEEKNGGLEITISTPVSKPGDMATTVMTNPYLVMEVDKMDEIPVELIYVNAE